MPYRTTSKVLEIIAYVTSEPGDGTKYDYAFTYDFASSTWVIWPTSSTFKFPVKLQDWDVNNLAEIIAQSEDIREQANLLAVATQHFNDCNPHTLREVVTAIVEFRKEIGA